MDDFCVYAFHLKIMLKHTWIFWVEQSYQLLVSKWVLQVFDSFSQPCFNIPIPPPYWKVIFFFQNANLSPASPTWNVLMALPYHPLQPNLSLKCHSFLQRQPHGPSFSPLSEASVVVPTATWKVLSPSHKITLSGTSDPSSAVTSSEMPSQTSHQAAYYSRSTRTLTFPVLVTHIFILLI